MRTVLSTLRQVLRVLVEIDAGQQVHLQCFFTEARPYQRDVSKLPGGCEPLRALKHGKFSH